MNLNPWDYYITVCVPFFYTFPLKPCNLAQHHFMLPMQLSDLRRPLILEQFNPRKSCTNCSPGYHGTADSPALWSIHRLSLLVRVLSHLLLYLPYPQDTELRPTAQEAENLIKQALELNPLQPLAIPLYIHLSEASSLSKCVGCIRVQRVTL